jgi:hypothetical protein
MLLGLIVLPILKNFENGSPVAWIIALGPLFLIWKLVLGFFRNSGNPDVERKTNRPWHTRRKR